jgi:hypothetical protein
MLLQNILTLIRIDNRVFQMKNMFRLYIVSPLLKKIVAMRRAVSKIKEGLAYFSLDLVYDLKG